MADLNALIAQGGQFKAPPNPFAQYAQMQQLTQGQQANELHRMQMQEYARGASEQNQLRQLDPSAPDYLSQVTRINPKMGFEFGKLQQDALTARTTQRTAQLDQQKKIRDFENQARRDLSLNPSPENIRAFGQDAVLQGLMTPEQADAKVQQYLSLPPEQLRSMLAGSGATAGELKPTLTPQNLGSTQQIIATNPFGGPATVVPGSVSQVTMTPGQAEANRLMEARLSQGERLAGARLDQGERRIALAEEQAKIANGTGLSPKEAQKREAKYPAATAAVKETLAAQDQLVKDLEALKAHPGLEGITGVVYGRTPSVTPTSLEAKAKLDKILSRGGFSELAKMRAASPTGGALGNISDVEGKYLRQAFGALDTTQSAGSFKRALDDVITELKGSRDRVQEAYDMTYDYKRGGGSAGQAASAPASTASPASGALTPAEAAELATLKARFKK